ncbi:cell division cycle protein 123 homolog [Toxorhynchites rutilus septentrionalis]|uniref:cell division cycle protein 123 homolog n=1 Tax=Toxorhynchites rutilus septentrionalis TaxID=329112 RepID=UPI002478FB00|nr:cell division cycle protein 123 homolog [Toxorhynchites rutilus septentrionalis]
MLLQNIELEKVACMLVNWYHQFKKNTIKSYIIPIPEDVIAYLRQELMILPKECSNTPSLGDTKTKHFNSYDDVFSDEDEEDEMVPEFPEFSKSITDTIGKLGGSVFMKTDWHCPRDAQWITLGQTLCVKDITDVYQLLKASSFCKEDIAERPPINTSGYHLILKKWRDIHPGTEFRCFVKNKSLVAISPRHWPSYHEHIAAERSDIVTDIVSLFKEKIKRTFPLKDYVFDVYRPAKDHVIIIDFSLFGKDHSDSLAFDYDQLNADALTATIEEEDDPEFRYLPEDCGIQPNKRNNYGFPQDVIEMFEMCPAQNGSSSGNNGNGDESLIRRLMSEWQLQSSEGDDANDE